MMNFKNLSNREYWHQRTIAQLSSSWAKESVSEKELQKYYLSALEDIKKEFESLLVRYGDGNSAQMKELNKLITPQERQRYIEDINKMVGLIGSDNEMAQAELAKLKMFKKITRLQAQLNRIGARLVQLGVQEEQLFSALLGDTYEDTYYKTLYELQVSAGMGTAFDLLNNRAIEEAIKYQWSGSMFSDYIWSNKDLLLKAMRETITNGLIRGESYWKMASNMDKAMDKAGFKNALRIIRTETAHIIGEATAEGYRQSGIVDQYTIIATLDRKTSSTCQSQDGEVYKLKDKDVGKNYPPFHPNCRTAVAPYFEDHIVNQRIARGLDGKNYYVDGSMTYKEWSEKYLNKNKNSRGA